MPGVDATATLGVADARVEGRSGENVAAAAKRAMTEA